MNKVIMMGRLTRDPEVRYGKESGKAVASFSIAVDRRFKREGDPDADFFNCTAFSKSAEFAEKYLKQGTKILITGKLQNESYINKEGQKVTVTKIIAEELEFAESKSAAGSSASSGNASHSNATRNDDGFMNIPDGVDDENLPFN